MCNACEDRSLPGFDRRHFLRGAAALAGGAVLAATGAVAAADECAPFLAADQSAVTPDQAIRMLADGNARFASGASLHCDLPGQMKATAEEQTPFACVLSCIDSRAAPEHVFDQQIGDIFVARVAGNVPTDEIIGSFEYATKAAGAKAIVVLGHSHCGAVKGAVDRADIGANLTVLLEAIEPAITATPLDGERSSKNHPFVEAVAETNVRLAVTAMTANSTVIAALVAEGSLKVVGAIYDIETGLVRFLS